MASSPGGGGVGHRADKPIVATVIGDPGGVGPEVAVRALADDEMRHSARHLLIGDLPALRSAAATVGAVLDFRKVDQPAEATSGGRDIAVLDPGTLDPAAWKVGQPSAASGHASIEWIRIAERLGSSGGVDGWIMAPVDSTSLKLSGEVATIDDLQPPDSYLLRVSGSLRIVPITEHIAIADIPASVTQEAVGRLIRIVDATFKKWGVASPRIGVAGLNPHAMGDEDAERIAPAVAAARSAGLNADGPVSPDAIFRQCIDGHYDVVVSMYHDQGQIALKTAAFEGACSIYLGPNHVHLTVPHGSAMDIAGKGIAQHHSMAAAMRMAVSLCRGGGFDADRG